MPHALVQQLVEIRATAATVEIFRRGVRVAAHVRSPAKQQASTIAGHRPKAHQKYLRQPTQLLDDAATIGPSTAAFAAAVLAAKRHPEQGYRCCLGLRRLAREYPPERMEAACERALRLCAFNLPSVTSMLQNKLDTRPLPPRTSAPAALPPA